MLKLNYSMFLALFCFSSLPYGGEGHHDVVQGVVESHGAGPRSPVCVLHLHQEVSEAGHDEDHHERLQAPAHELRAQDENLPALPPPERKQRKRKSNGFFTGKGGGWVSIKVGILGGVRFGCTWNRTSYSTVVII